MMSSRDFQPRLAPTKTPRPWIGSRYILYRVLFDALKFQTRLLLGAIVQIVLCALLPFEWAIVPAGAFLLHSIAITVVQVFSQQNNPYMQDVVLGRTSAQLPSATDGSYGSKPASQSFVYFNLGVQFNHPLGPLSPHAKDLSDRNERMLDDLVARREEYGLLDVSVWTANEKESNSTLMHTMIWKDLESLHRFAHEKLHKEAWDWWVSKAKSPKHIGIFHDTFVVPAENYESVYINCRPVTMGKAQVKIGASAKDKGEFWQSSLVSADSPALKTQYARMFRHEDGMSKA